MIFDECHHIGARVFSQAMYRISNAKYILGLSATPKRRDGLTFVLQWFLGDVVFLAERYNTNNELGVEVKRVVVKQKGEGGGDVHFTEEDDGAEDGFSGEEEENEENGEENDDDDGDTHTRHRKKRRKKGGGEGGSKGGLATVLTDLVTDVAQKEGRNRIIAEQIIACCREGRKILVLSDRIKHLRLLERQLITIATERGEARVDAGYYIGGMSFGDLQASVKKPVLLGSYPMSSEE